MTATEEKSESHPARRVIQEPGVWKDRAIIGNCNIDTQHLLLVPGQCFEGLSIPVS
jgi:hypothetical protein